MNYHYCDRQNKNENMKNGKIYYDSNKNRVF